MKAVSPKLRDSSTVVSSDREVAEIFKILLTLLFVTLVLRRELVSLRPLYQEIAVLWLQESGE